MKKRILLVLLTVVLICATPFSASANSAEPPGIIILVTNAPDDLNVTLEIPSDDWRVDVTKSTKMWEKYFRIFYHPTREDVTYKIEDATLSVTSSEKSFKCPLPENLSGGYRYNMALYLDYENETLTLGEPAYRAPLLISIRLILTLALEGAVFLLLRFRKKSSWIIFLIVNLLTQGWLNYMISGSDLHGSSGYLVIAFIAMELLIFTVESVAISIFVREGRWYKRLCFALLANTVSLVLGIVAMSYLPI